ncbi:hypothetical protein ACQR16_15570 [Bradyrhizobium oligotrophicum]|uniref:hypothetical protein n=1 Tax=Bradyrhizobium oligotrophicum TaxID=44255 RepID=UPI003EBDB83D
MKKNSFRLKEVLTGARVFIRRNARSNATIDIENADAPTRDGALATHRDCRKSLCCKHFPELQRDETRAIA